jgi:hypothetical protein
MAAITDRKPTPKLFSRVSPAVATQVQEVADREFDGNVSMLVRIAVKQFIEDRTGQVITFSDTSETPEAA